MKHFVCFPSADPMIGLTCAKKWIERGYDAMILLDPPNWLVSAEPRLHLIHGPIPFPGYYKVINTLTTAAFDAGADVVTCIGDDMLPDPIRTAEDIAQMYLKRFPKGEGILQAVGDAQGEKIGGEWNSQRICGSPTFGRNWFSEGYPYEGGFCSQYRSFYGDEDLQNVAKKKGLLWQELTLKIDHLHWAFGRSHKQPYHDKAQKNWDEDAKTFQHRKAADFV